MINKILHYIKNKPIELIIIITIISIIFICIGHKYRDNIQSKLKKNLLVVPSFIVDYWSITHFVLYLLYGFIYPNYPLLFTIIGILWEIFEDFLASDENTQLYNCKKKKGIWCNGIQDGYWYYKFDDVIFNTYGYLVGQAIRNYLKF